MYICILSCFCLSTICFYDAVSLLGIWQQSLLKSCPTSYIENNTAELRSQETVVCQGWCKGGDNVSTPRT